MTKHRPCVREKRRSNHCVPGKGRDRFASVNAVTAYEVVEIHSFINF